jgi:hypothetical protein
VPLIMNLAFSFLWLIAAIRLGAEFDDPSMDGPFSPMLLMLLSTLFLVVLVILVLAIIVIVVTALTAIGIVSSSALIGVFRRRWSTGLRAFHYQLCAVLGVACGIGLTWGVARLSDVQFSVREVLAVGALAGLCGGTLMAFVMDRLVCMVHRRYFPAMPPGDR